MAKRDRNSYSHLNPGLYARVDGDNKVLGLFNHSRCDDMESYMESPIQYMPDWFKESEEELKGLDERNQRILAGAVYEFGLRFRGALKVARAMRGGKQVYLTGVSIFKENDLYAWVFGKNAKVNIEHVEADWHNPLEYKRHGEGIIFHFDNGALVDKLYLSR